MEDTSPVQTDEPVAEPTEEETETPETEEVTTEETPEETTEETPAEETPEEEPEKEEATEEEPPVEEKKSSRKGKGAEKRIKSLVGQKRRLEEKLAQSTTGQPVQGAISQPQAAQAVTDIQSYYQQNGQLPQEISPEDYQHLVNLAEGRTQAQQDIQSAEQGQRVDMLERKLAAQEISNKFSQDVQDAVEAHPVLNKVSTEYDAGFEEELVKALDEATDENPLVNVRRFIDTHVRVYKQARTKGGESTNATLAKQAAGSAIPPTSSTKTGKKSDEEKSLSELAAEIGSTGTGDV